MNRVVRIHKYRLEENLDKSVNKIRTKWILYLSALLFFLTYKCDGGDRNLHYLLLRNKRCRFECSLLRPF